MNGLLGLSDRPGLLSAPRVGSGFDALSAQLSAIPARPAAPVRQRVNPLRVLDNFLFDGNGFGAAADAERTRLDTMARAPSLEAQRARLASIAANMGPAAELAYAANPEKFAENVSEQYGVTTTSAGGRSDVLGQPSMGVTAPTFTTVNDTIFRNEPGSGMSTPTVTAPAAFSDITARDKAVADAEIARGELDVKRLTANRPDVTTLAPGAEAIQYDAAGNIVGRTASTQARPMSDADQAAVARADNQIVSLDTSLTRAGEIRRQIANKELNLGLLENTVGGLRNLGGMSDQNSLNYDALLAWAKEARNAILQANTGVQTDQDAIRELDTILSSTRDERIVDAALGRFEVARSATKQALERDIARRSGGQTAQSTAPASLEAEAARRGFRRDANGRWVR